MQHKTHNGVKLCYEETGTGSPTLVFVHGLTCDAWHFAPQVDHFKKKHRVINLVLRGHGESDKPKQDYTIQGYSDDIYFLCKELNVQKAVFIGHSLGGVINFDLAARHPDVVAGIVSLDAPIVMGPDFGSVAGPLLEGLKTPQYMQAWHGFMDQVILPTDDQARKAQIKAKMASTPQYVLANTFQSVATYDGPATAKACKTPAMYVGGVFPVDTKRLKELCPQVMLEQIDGVGHFASMEAPGKVNAAIEKFVTTLKA